MKSGPYLERAEKTRDGHSHLSKHGHTQPTSRVSTANSLFILLISQIIRRVFETCGCCSPKICFHMWFLSFDICHALLLMVDDLLRPDQISHEATNSSDM